MKESYGCPGDIMLDARIGAWVGELPDCFKGINSEDSTASGNVQHLATFSQENQSQLVPIKMSDLEQNDRTQEVLQNIARFQVRLIVCHTHRPGHQGNEKCAIMN